MEYEIERHASFEKKRGIVHLSSTHLVWTPDCAADGNELSVPFTKIRQYQVSKAGGKKAMIRMVSVDRAAPIMLDFGSSFGDRDAIRDVLDRRLTPAGAASNANLVTPASALAQSPAENHIKSKFVADWSSLPAEQRNWRQLLMRKKDVLALHLRLVAGGIVDDETFWKGMNCKYKQNGQRRGSTAAEIEDFDSIGSEKGVPSAAFDNPGDSETDHGLKGTGDVPSSAERHLIFMKHPAVSLAYRAKVLDASTGAKMSDASFWSVFRKSSMAQSHLKGTNRAAAIATEADAMFAEFHARKTDSFAASEQKLVESIDSKLNMDRFDDHRQLHVLDGHASGGDAPRGLKRRRGLGSTAGESRGLDVMRKLNHHGTMILDGVGKGITHSWRDDERERQHPLPDLEAESTPEFTKLELNDGNALLGLGRTALNSAKQGEDYLHNSSEDDTKRRRLEALAKSMYSGLRNWRPNIARLYDGLDGAGPVLDEVLELMKP